MKNEDVGASRHFHFSFFIFHFSVPAAVLFFVLHLPYLPQSLEDVDSINFALGTHAFDVARHQPHPPGYPLFIALAKGVRPLVDSDVRALALLSAAAGALGILALAALAARCQASARQVPGRCQASARQVPGRCQAGARQVPGTDVLAVALAATAPLYWFTANRPLSDMTGLAATLAVQTLILSATTTRAFLAAAFCAGFAIGLRSQVFWLATPLLAMMAARWTRDRHEPAAARLARLVPALFAYAAGVAAWAVPLALLSGGPRAYWHALFDQGAEDLSGIRMLWTTPTRREFADALYYAFVAPWAVWWLAAVVLALAVVGAATLWRRDRRVLATIVVAFGPYLLFDLLFQETFTSRYALPLVIPVALLAARGAEAIPAYAGVALAIASAVFGAHLGGTSLAAYSRQPAPAFRLFADMRRTVAAQPPVVAMDRREALDLRAPAKYLGGFPPNVHVMAQAPPQHEALRASTAWDGREPLWFIADPKRTDIDLIQHGEPQRYRWSLPYPVLIGGVRPNEMDWYELTRPDWWLGPGWALTPETAGVADLDGAGLAHGAIDAHLDRGVPGGAAILGGRNFEASAHARLELRLNGQMFDAFDAAPGPFVRAVTLPGAAGDRATLSVRATPPSRVAIEQFDASATRTLFAYADGWHEQEYDPDTGLRWRWVSEHGDLRIVSPRPAGALVLRMAGESPTKYFSRPSALTVRADGAPVFSTTLADDFSLTIPIPRAAAVIAIDTDQTYVPAERSRRTRDRRRLGLRIFSCEVRAVSAPGR